MQIYSTWLEAPSVRQAIVLVVGLLLISIWGIGLKAVLKRMHDHLPPPRIPALSDANPIPARNTQVSDAGHSTKQPNPSQVVLAAFMNPGMQPQQGTSLDSVVDTEVSEENWIWKFDPNANKEVWLRGTKAALKFNIPDGLDFSNVEFASDFAGAKELNTSGIVEIDLSGITENDVRADLRIKTNDASNPNLVTEFKLAKVASGGVRIHRSTATGPYAPNLLKARAGTHYPWEAHTNAGLTIEAFKDRRTKIGAQVQAYNQSQAILAVVLGIRENGGSQEIQVLSSPQQQVPGKGIATFSHAIETGQLSGQDISRIQIAYAAIGAGDNLNHNFTQQKLTINLSQSAASLAALQATVTQIGPERTGGQSSEVFDGTTRFYTTNQRKRPSVQVTMDGIEGTDLGNSVACVLQENQRAVSAPEFANKQQIDFAEIRLSDGSHQITPRLYAGEEPIEATQQAVTIEVKTGGFRIADARPKTFGSKLGEQDIYLEFTRPVATTTIAHTLLFSDSGHFTPDSAKSVTAAPQSTSDPATHKLHLANVAAGYYQLTVYGSKLQDFYGNVLETSNGIVGGNFVQTFGGPAELAADDFPVVRGVSRGKAPHVVYPEFVEPRKSTRGFNPGDKVETRVARLYFYRDAHRVAQILNRKVESYNRQEVSARRQLAGKARQEAESLTTNRQAFERKAIQDAQRTRELENQLSDTQRSLDSSLNQLRGTAEWQPTDEQQIQQKSQIVSQLETAVRSFAGQAQELESQIRAARDTEIASNERWQEAQRAEDLARTDQFRLETAAAHTDPDTFAAGDPQSIDPVAQVSISVIGEGLLHLRGPLKGVNQVRMMVDQIDAPQGQVRVNVHSTQINGDEADHLESVANSIQTYIDQARFLTIQSGEMLRKAVVHVAAGRVEQTRNLYGGATQAERDQLYLYAFFGRDFVDELRAMDSELLHTGNKLLSLHSMDVTSLSSALMLLALANNETRLAILEEFQRLTQGDLAVAEQQYLRNALHSCAGGCKRGCKLHPRTPPVCMLSQNATFTSLRGFFDAQLAHADTMSPMQREMIRLSQILKARLITEMEYKQRVMERAVIEERIVQSDQTQSDQIRREAIANQQYQLALRAQLDARATLIANLPKTTAELDNALNSYQGISQKVEEFLALVQSLLRGTSPESNANSGQRVDSSAGLYRVLNIIDGARSFRENEVKKIRQRFDLRQNFRLQTNASDEQSAENGVTASGMDAQRLSHVVNSNDTNLALQLYASPAAYDPKTKQLDDRKVYLVGSPEERTKLLSQIQDLLVGLRNAQDVLRPFAGDQSETRKDLNELLKGLEENDKRVSQLVFVEPPADGAVPFISIHELREAISRIIRMIKRWEQNEATLQKTKSLQSEFQNQYVTQIQQSGSQGLTLAGLNELLRIWGQFRNALVSIYGGTSSTGTRWTTETRAAVSATDQALGTWVSAFSELDAARAIAQDARRPLDHKKFLDMLIDDLEDKYIELLEGTRAHTANIDNYLKRLTTSLDDDFNTQFYNPVFRLVREASQFKRVEFGQTETTGVLANNRQFAKVSPSATMEFDLPKRDILVAEGIDSALAIYNDVGALIGDPNLLALAKMQSGSPTSGSFGGALGGRAAISNVLPGLASDTSQQLLAQNAGSGPEFESNVEKLIPDPAVYKFETGTGYEIRPVIAPDGQAVVFDFHYLYTTQIREPVRADEKHLGRVKQHLIDTDVQLSNFELREISRYVVALKAERTANGVPLLEDIPVVGALWRPLPNREKSLQQNIIMAQATIFPTLFDLMGLRWAPAVADLDPLRLSNREYLVRGRHQFLENRIYDYSSSRVDEFLRIPEDSRRADLYRSQESIPSVHPNGYRGQGLDYENSQMREGYSPEEAYQVPGFIPSRSPEGAVYLPHRQQSLYQTMPRGSSAVEEVRPIDLAPPSQRPGISGIEQLPPATQVPADRGGWQYPSGQ